MTVLERLKALRELMKERKIDAYLVPTDDFHASEYVGDYFKCRKYITGFTGSAGTAVIMQDMAGLWTDGRYFTQALTEMEGSGVRLMKMFVDDTPSTTECRRCINFLQISWRKVCVWALTDVQSLQGKQTS